MIWIGYTTKYRGGGDRLERAARTMEAEKIISHQDFRVMAEPVETKRAFVDAMTRLRSEKAVLHELHLFSHSGMYGPMFGMRSLPEQFSPWEWRNMVLPLGPECEAWFHSCRTARWFAPYFARTFGIPAHGYHNYTTFSRRPDRFAWEAPFMRRDQPLYVVSCPGRKSHGLPGTALKYSHLAPIEPLIRFLPRTVGAEATYHEVAALYDEAFADIRVRDDEWRWLLARIPAESKPRVLDIGCGNGALLAALSDRISRGEGVDASEAMLERARARFGNHPNLNFRIIDGPILPYGDREFDLVVSLLSFRYLDWDPIMNEIRRVLAPGGKILIVDMVTAPVRPHELPILVRSTARHLLRGKRHPSFSKALSRLVSHSDWATMLKYNPIRAEHELRWYLESRYSGRCVEVLNVSRNNRILAFDSGPLQPGWIAPQSYP